MFRLPTSARVALLAVAVVAVQLATQASGKGFYLTQLTMTGYYTLVVLGLSLLMGYAGQISLGQAGFFAIGGYAAAFLSSVDLSAQKSLPVLALATRIGLLVARPDLYGGTILGVNPWAGLVLGVALASGVAFLVGVPVLRLRGHYLAMATLAFGTIVSAVVVGTQRLGAADGISGVPPFPILPGVRIGGGSADRVANYYLAWGLVALAMLLLGTWSGPAPAARCGPSTAPRTRPGPWGSTPPGSRSGSSCSPPPWRPPRGSSSPTTWAASDPPRPRS